MPSPAEPAPVLQSLGMQTDVDVLGEAGEVVPLGNGVVAVRASTMPTYHWGNFVVFPRAPQPGDLPAWAATFDAAFADLPGVRHRSLAWHDPSGAVGDVAQFTDAGYEYEPGAVLATRAPVEPPHFDAALDVRVVTGPAEWEAVVACSMACRPDGQEDPASWEAFVRSRHEHFRHLERLGRLRWLAAWVDGQVVGNLGVCVVGGRCRYQSVETHPAYRRRGVCATLVHRAARLAVDELGARDLVIVAIAGEPAERVYRSCGFEHADVSLGVRLPTAHR